MRAPYILCIAALCTFPLGAEGAESTGSADAIARSSVFEAILHDDAESPEVSTSELRAALSAGNTLVLDARPYEEYAISHIPGALSVPGKPGTTPALYVADVNAIIQTAPDRFRALILYCNGLHCGRSKRFADDLIKAGYQNVRRYQLGAPAWRALGGVMQVERDALIRLLAQDGTALLVDSREIRDSTPQLRKATWIALRDASKAKDDGRLPMTDHNTRILVVGDDARQARLVAEAIIHDAFHNVSFYAGSIKELKELHACAGDCSP